MFKGHKEVAVSFLCSLLAGLFIVGIICYNDLQERRNYTHNLLMNQARQISERVTNAMDQAYVLRAMVLGAEGKEVDLSRYGEYLLTENVKVRNILVAPQGIVSQVYPLADNEAVLGLNLLGKENASATEAANASRTHSIVMTPPYKLKQGGQAISGRLAVYIPDGKGSEEYWGMVSVTVDYPAVFQSEGLEYLEEMDYAYRLFYLPQDGSKQTPEENVLAEYKGDKLVRPEQVKFSVNNMQFVLEAVHADGWYSLLQLALSVLLVLVLSAFLSIIVKSLVASRVKWKEKATKDDLTGAYNRDTAIRMINKLMQEDGFEKGAMVVCDLDNFKQVNDVLGHNYGDRVLRETAQLLQQNCRDVDVVCRFGGDEFFIFLPYAGTGDFLQHRLEVILKALDKSFEKDGKVVAVTGSIGLALTEVVGKDYQALYEAADQALYEAKANGKNQIKVYQKA